MKFLKFGKLNTLLGIILMMVIFILPISYTTLTLPISASNDGHEEYDLNESDIAKLIYNEKINRIDSFLNIHHQNINFQGNVLVAYKNNLIYKESFGYSNPKNSPNSHSLQVLARGISVFVVWN